MLPRAFASDDLFTSGSAASTETKTDPGAALSAQGFIPGRTGAQHHNWLFHSLTVAARRQLALTLCKPRRLGITCDQAGGIGVCSLGQGLPAIVGNGHSGGVPKAFEGDVTLGGVVASLSIVNGAAYNPAGRIVLVGGGGNRCCYSTDNGVNWIAGGDVGGTTTDVIWNPVYSRFQASYPGHLRYSTDATSWTDVAVTGHLNRGIARLPNGDTFVVTAENPVVLKRSLNGGTSWVAAAAVPNATQILANRGTITGTGRDNVYHAAITDLLDGLVQISSTADGVTWSVKASLPLVGSYDFVSTAIIKQCPDTGVLFLLVGQGAGTLLIYASLDQGATWTEPLQQASTTFECMDVAHGRLFLLNAAGELFATDGAGWE